MDEPRRDKQIGLRFTAIEEAEIRQAAAYANMQPAQWCRMELLKAARGERAAKNVEVPRAELDGVHATLARLAKVQLAVLEELLEHTHHGDPLSEHEDPRLRSLGRKRAERKMREAMAKLGLNGSGQ